ncbi:MAG: M20/M25/M40 family metallo-hydrolase, partial [Planctomycetota bacterium]|nr:M20/M25/M40 family metallo-hydrolase [Planctomycetota bacterium]
TDVIRLLPGQTAAGATFELDENLEVIESIPDVMDLQPTEDGNLVYLLDRHSEESFIQVTYTGKFRYGISDPKEEYSRGMRSSRGQVGPEGIYLDGGSLWVPKMGDDLITFAVEVTGPEGWHVVSQGQGSSSEADAPEGKSLARWSTTQGLEQVYLVGGPLNRYESQSEDTQTLVYLHEDEPGIASKYLGVTGRYIDMYSEMLGEYPYGKFALVENFWETGYGMPSFTLLGERVIRMPFILHSSYPHEILHNWWGNSVFVDYETGNWCEGLTAYMADHLIQEQRGKGAGYRRNSLQKYRNYVAEGKDFPLSQFRSRHSAATEAVGYGKSLMLFHMLRRQVGEDVFRQGLRHFYQDNIGKRASFDDVRASFEKASGGELAHFFEQWVPRTGAPVLTLGETSVEATQEGYELRFGVSQNQGLPLYKLHVPVTVTTESGVERFKVWLTEVSTPNTRTFTSKPISIALDPEFDIFRMLDPRETPPTIGQVFGDTDILAVLPSVDPEESARYKEMVRGWETPEHHIRFVSDSELTSWPVDQSAWILGRNNLWAKNLTALNPQVSISEDGSQVQLAGETISLKDHSLVALWRHPDNLQKVLAWLVVEPEAATAGMQTKLPHYGKYSSLAFEGDAPNNMLKGQWPAAGSPLVRDLREVQSTPMPALAPEERAAMAELPPEFSARKLMSHVTWLADPAREGRGLGSQGLEDSAAYIADQMRAAGLQPGGDDGTYFQNLVVDLGPQSPPIRSRNVIGLLPGSNADWKDQSIVLSAHYDHLGFGWPNAHAGNEGKLHAGADDNASGVSVMLELAANLVAEGPRPRTLVVAAFTAEECGLHGSKHYVANPVLPLEQVRGVINLDTVGRFGEKGVSIHGCNTASEWQHIFRGAGFTTGIANQIVMGGAEASDQASFVEKGVPGVQLFTGAHGDYHRPSDTVDQVNGPGLVQVAVFAKEGVAYMLEREEPLTITIEGSTMPTKVKGAKAPTQQGGRRVSFGTVPDFSFGGPGVRVDSVVAESPAAAGGVLAGDILLEVNGEEIDDLRGFSDLLKTLDPGQTVETIVQRGEEEITLSVTVVAR